MAGYKKRTSNADALEFGARLTEAQEASGATNADIAKATGAPLNTVSKWRNGGQLPNAHAVSAIAHTVGRSEHWLLSGEEREGEIILENSEDADDELLHALRLTESLIKKRILRLYGRSR